MDVEIGHFLAFLAGIGLAVAALLVKRRMERALPAPKSMPDQPKAEMSVAAAAPGPFLQLAGASHEFRTPLNGILGMAHLLAETDLDAEQMAYVDAVRSAGNALLLIVDDVLDAARMEAGHFEPVQESFDIVTLVEGVTELLSPRAMEKGLGIAASVPAGMPRMAVGDSGRLRQALINLAGNAIKFTAKGSIGIYLSRSGEGKLELAVEDTGPGIAEHQRQRIFEAFEQIEGEPAKREGSGLGLSITRNIIERYNGRIDLRSRIGEGTRFTVSLDWRSETPGVTAAQRQDLSGQSILVVARDDHQRRMLRDHLLSAHASVACVDGIASAIERIGKTAPSILIVDGSFGALATELCRLAEHAGIARKIVLLSPGERRIFGSPKEIGFDAFLMKPVRTNSLFDRIMHAPLPAPQADRDTVAVLPLAGSRILIAEDDPVSAHLLRRLLEKRGASVTVAHDGPSALGLLTPGSSVGHFDAAILDKVLPGGISGLDIARAIRAGEQPQQRRMHLLCSSADFGPAETARAMTAGCDDVLPKPVDPARLERALLNKAHILTDAA